MFVLTKVDSDKEKFILIPSKATYTIGRLSTDFILAKDLSISRTHVRLCLPSAGSAAALTVEDLGSRYGTFINDDIRRNRKMSANTPTPIQIGDKVRFGALENVWQLSQLKLMTTASALSREELLELNQLISPLNGTILPSWTDECSHLTMDTVTITVKLLHALLQNKPIVRVEFWRELLKLARRLHVSEDWPRPENFAPVQPADMPSIKWRPERTKLFAGKTFVFMNRKHLEMYGPVVQKASGACKDLNSGVRKPFLTKPNVVVIQYVASTQSQATETIFSVQGILEQAGLRPIPDYEIGLAILHCSMDKFCNPSHKITENSLATTESMDSSILVPNTERTQTEHCKQNNASEFVVAESQKSEIYALSVGSEKQESEPQPNPAPKQSKTKLHSRQKNAIYLDSSDEDVEVIEEQTKKPKALIENGSKRKIDRLVDSSDEVQPEPHQLRKRTKTSTENSSANRAAQENVAKPDALSNEEDLVDDCQLVKKKTNDIPQKQPATNAARRSTRSHPQVEQIVVQTKAPASPRRSPRGKQTAGKVILSIAQSDDDSEQDEGLFQFKTQDSASMERAPFRPTEVNIESNSVLSKKSVARPKVNKPARISVRNFLEKSQNHVASQNAGPTASQPRKRVRLQQINESDSDDNENLFQFAGAKKLKRTNGSSRSDNDSNDEDLFNFKGRTQQEHSKSESDDDQDSVCTEPFVPETKIKSKYIVPKPKERPRKVNISAWLSCSGLHEEVKTEPKPDPDISQMNADTVKEETKDDKEKLEHLKWLASIKDSIQVRMCNMSISVRGADETDASNTTENKYSARKNFKKFAKKSNAHSQRHIVGLKRMQLAEGMVSDL
ncbi:nibrin [Drosophila montana]|uniref:nibrin n=1 Tax=Drosophila montana TaxID=40370 RepID=UPI00313DC80A